jgi:hypothetical protein
MLMANERSPEKYQSKVHQEASDVNITTQIRKVAGHKGLNNIEYYHFVAFLQKLRSFWSKNYVVGTFGEFIRCCSQLH